MTPEEEAEGTLTRYSKIRDGTFRLYNELLEEKSGKTDGGGPFYFTQLATTAKG